MNEKIGKVMGITLERDRIPYETTLSYDSEDPYAVKMVITHVRTNQKITWRLARDLLRDGLTGLAGDGDIRIWPSEIAASRLNVQLRDHKSGRSSTFTTSKDLVATFVRRIFDAIPAGEEHRWADPLADFDRELAELLMEGS